MSRTTAEHLLANSLSDGNEDRVVELAQAMDAEARAGLVARLRWIVELVDDSTWCAGCRKPARLADYGVVLVDGDGTRWHGPCKTSTREGT